MFESTPTIFIFTFLGFVLIPYKVDIKLIQHRIYELRGQRIMLDFDLAELYAVETRVLNQVVRRNVDIFPEDFIFKLTKDEWEMLSQIVMT